MALQLAAKFIMNNEPANDVLICTNSLASITALNNHFFTC